ncbi:MAG: hypothetical protein KDJ97_25405 [Anaerolineae bacterium]|nr:hypothetical protein [Anaerolineae bacterium]
MVDIQLEQFLRYLTPTTINQIIVEFNRAEEDNKTRIASDPIDPNIIKARDICRSFMRRNWEPFGYEVE